MKPLLTKIDWIFEYYFAYFLYNPYNRHKYHAHMYTKWGEKYCTKKEYEDYLESLDQGNMTGPT